VAGNRGRGRRAPYGSPAATMTPDATCPVKEGGGYIYIHPYILQILYIIYIFYLYVYIYIYIYIYNKDSGRSIPCQGNGWVGMGITYLCIDVSVCVFLCV